MRLLKAAFLLLMITSPVLGQDLVKDLTKSAGLKNLKMGELHIVGLGPEGQQQCGLSEAELRQAVMLPIQSFTKFRFGAPPVKPAEGISLPPRLELALSLAGNEGQCAVAMRLEVHTYRAMKLPHYREQTFELVVLWRNELVFAGPKRTLMGSAQKWAETLARQFATDWQQDNP